MFRIARAALGLTMAAAGIIAVGTPANATTVYSSDSCSSTTRCFAIFYNSKQNIGIFYSSCFITNKSEYSHEGYSMPTPSGLYTVRYQFDYGNDLEFHDAGSACRPSEGSGQGVKNNAAGAVNEDSASHRVYYNTGYGGTYQTYYPGDSKNLIAALKNENASSERL
ncbi:hypothetical protein OG259_09660 [Streptomyces sp. NBC_00250]|uniref:hypothetical protein n=1 Tax=Streptomyces sp. NBC_00250 TaxID=2903641 RepID=UPI002E29FD85|nr:hypothetical protein [Streptomyces sp. NBC_00250]